MEDDTEIIEEIKEELGANYKSNDEKVLRKIYTRLLLIASDTTNRKENDKRLIPYVEQATISTYLRRGKEGSSGYTEGSESDTFIDIEEKLRNDLIKNGLRRLA
jgi:hypothetical protein